MLAFFNPNQAGGEGIFVLHFFNTIFKTLLNKIDVPKKMAKSERKAISFTIFRGMGG